MKQVFYPKQRVRLIDFHSVKKIYIYRKQFLHVYIIVYILLCMYYCTEYAYITILVIIQKSKI